MSRSGAASKTLPKCRYFEELCFIHNKLLNKDTASNVSLSTLNPPTLLSLALNIPTNAEAVSNTVKINEERKKNVSYQKRERVRLQMNLVWK